MKTLIELRRRLNEILTEMVEIDKTETEAKRNYLENEKYVALQEEERSVLSDIQTAEVVAADRKRRDDAAKALRAANPAPGLEENRQPAKVHENAEDRPFESFGEKLIAIRNAAAPGSDMDPRLRSSDIRNAEVRAVTGLNETALQDGGFLVGQDNGTTLLTRGMQQTVLLPKCREIPLGPNSNGVKLPYVDETSRVNGSRWGGVQIYFADEADTATPSKPKFGRLELNLKKAIGLCYATDDLLADGTALEAYITQAYAEEFGFVMDDKVLRGNGAGTMLGILNSAALVTVTKETSQANTTIKYANILKMAARLWPKSMARAEWYCNVDTLPQLQQMTVDVKNVAGTENVGGSAVYVPPGGVSGAPYGTLMGRPVNIIEQASTLGAVGDISLLDLSQYLTIKRDLKIASSIHVRFLYDESVFRFVYRIDGTPAWKTTLTPAQGSNTLSPFVTLGGRP